MLVGLIASTGLVLTTGTQVAHAATYFVRATEDHLDPKGDLGVVSLREAVREANDHPGVTEIVLTEPGTYELSICGAAENGNLEGDLDYTGEQTLTIRGDLADRAVIKQMCTGSSSFDADSADRAFDHRGAGTLILENIMVRDAGLPNGSRFFSIENLHGGAIRSAAGGLVLDDVFLFNNHAGRGANGFTATFPAPIKFDATRGGDGGAVYSGTGDVTIRNSRLEFNHAGDGGTGSGSDETLSAGGGNGGALFSERGTVTITDSWVLRNTAGSGGAGSGDADGAAGGDGGAVYMDEGISSINPETIDVQGSRFDSLNQAGDGGNSGSGSGGKGGSGGAIYTGVKVVATIADSTFEANRGGRGGDSGSGLGGDGGSGGAIAASEVDLADTVLDNNKAGNGGDLSGDGGDGGAIAAYTRLKATRVLAIDNSAGHGYSPSGRGGSGGAFSNREGNVTVMTIDSSSFFENAAGDGGVVLQGPNGGGGWGGAIHNLNASDNSTNLTNVTLLSNAVGSGDVPPEQGAAIAANNLDMRYSTVAGHDSAFAVSKARTFASRPGRITASVIGDNPGGNCSISHGSGGYNYEGGTDTCSFHHAFDWFNMADLGLEAALGSESHYVRVPITGGVLDGLIVSDDCSAGDLNGVTTDQRGISRPLGSGCEPGASEAVTPELNSATRFVPLPPVRLFDTRVGEPAAGPKGFVAAKGTIDVQIHGAGGVPTHAVAVVMNVTATSTEGPSFVTAYPKGESLPLASSINITQAGQTRPNLVTVPIGAEGKVSLYTLTGAHLIGDVAGYYTDVDTAIDAGRFVPVTPQRLFDTRPGEPAPGHKGKLGAGESIDVQVSGVGDVPSAGVAAVIVNITGTQASAPGFITAHPTGQSLPLVSNVNLDFVGATAPNLAVVPLGAGGRITLYSSHGTHVLGDVTGYITDDTVPFSVEGLFVPLTPERVFDTREGEAAPGPKGYVGANSKITAKVGGVGNLPAGARAVVLNVTGIGGPAGFLTAWERGPDRPLASTLNLAAPVDTRANGAMLPVGTAGEINFYTLSGSHILVDASGFFLGTP